MDKMEHKGKGRKGKEKILGQDGLVGKGACCQATGPEFDSWNHMVKEEN